LALGAGGTIWFSIADTAHAIGKLSPSGQVTVITPGNDGLDPNAVPLDMAAAPDGTVWFLDDDNTKAGVGAISPSGQISEYPDSTGSLPGELTVAADGDAWFTVAQGSMKQPAGVAVAKLGAPTTTKAQVFPTDSGSFPMTMPTGITQGGDGDLYFADPASPGIGRVTPSGTVGEFGMLNGPQTGSQPDALTAAPDGNVWFDDQLGTKPAVGKITPSGQISEFPIAGEAWDLTVGIDGNVWLPVANNDQSDTGVARVTTATGQIDIFSGGLRAGAFLNDGTNIVSGLDGNLWFIDLPHLGNPGPAIGRADVQLPPTVTTGAATNVTASGAQIAGTANARGAASTVTIQYGTTPALGSSAPAGSEPAGDTAGAVSATISGLPANTVIHYRLVANNAYGTAARSTLSFKTATKPPSRTRTVHATVGNRRITFTVPALTPCLAASARPQRKLGSARIPGSKAAKPSFKRAVVLIDRGIKRTRTKLVTVHHHKHRKRVTVYVPNATARHLPATLSPSLRGLRRGTHALRITLTYTGTRHVGHRTTHTTATRTIKTTFTVC
jgi:streptogramin lyase